MELNREQIIKALECCLVESNCTGCPLHHQYETDCLKYAGEKALSLIKELTVELEAVWVALSDANNDRKKLTEENERLREELAKRPPKLIITKKEKK